MTPQQIGLVRKSFLLVIPISKTAAALFYKRLFELDPALRKLFTGDIEAQGDKLMAMLASVVENLDRPERLVPAAQDLGLRHVRYGVQDAQYDTVGSALLWTLQTGLGNAYTSQVASAWAAAYLTLSDIMRTAASRAFEDDQ